VLTETDTFAHFRRTYPECSDKEIRDLVEAIRGDKYWLVQPGKKDALYVVALTRAQIPLAEGYQARATYVGAVSVTSEAAPYCRRGRVIAVARHVARFIGTSVILWPEFLQLIRLDSALVYHALLHNQLPAFINRRIMKEFRQKLETLSSQTA